MAEGVGEAGDDTDVGVILRRLLYLELGTRRVIVLQTLAVNFSSFMSLSTSRNPALLLGKFYCRKRTDIISLKYLRPLIQDDQQ